MSSSRSTSVDANGRALGPCCVKVAHWGFSGCPGSLAPAGTACHVAPAKHGAGDRMLSRFSCFRLADVLCRLGRKAVGPSGGVAGQEGERMLCDAVCVRSWQLERVWVGEGLSVRRVLGRATECLVLGPTVGVLTLKPGLAVERPGHGRPHADACVGLLHMLHAGHVYSRWLCHGALARTILATAQPRRPDVA